MAKTPSKIAAFKKSWQDRQKTKQNQHRSFRRSYHEDYARDFAAPGLLHHAVTTFRIIFKNWRLFLPLLILIVVMNILLVGLMSEDTYTQLQDTIDDSLEGFKNGQGGQVARAGLLLISTVTTGGLTQGASEVQQVFAILLFVVLWLTVIYILRHRLAGHNLKLRDALYNALTPFISTLIVALIILVELVPVAVVVITYSAAVSTNFLATPFYALVFFIFAALMILLSIYLVSSTLLALIAVSAPGLYPLVAIRTANDLVASRRIRWIIRVLFLFLVFAVVWVLVMLPLILLDLWLKSIWDWTEGLPFISLMLQIMTTFTAIYLTAYLYLFYRHMLNFDDETIENPKDAEEVELVAAEKKAPSTKPVRKSKRRKNEQTRSGGEN
ncbi:hypothetical protein IJ114_02190 [Candidatus Saccharibacteria bacterium]|nr:hypothetical protein [Candidatus Saccharibacteria bacterium]